MDAATWSSQARRIPAGDIDIACRVDGHAGTPVLLLMGLAMPGRAWGFQLPDLARFHRVATFDNRGVGGTSRAPGPYRMEQLADDALAVLDGLGWADAHVVGVSMGGMIAQWLALRAPTRLRSLTLIATHAGGLRAVPPHPKGAALFVRAQLGDRRARGAALEQLLFPPTFLARCDRTWLRKTLTDDLGDPPPLATRRAQIAAVLRHNSAAQLGKLHSLPTLLVRPGQDILVRPGEVDRLARLLPHAQVLRLDDAGHGLIRQVPEVLNPALLAHLAAADAAASRAS